MITLSIKVKPGSFKDEILIDSQRNWTIKIREKPIDGAANIYLIKFLAKEFKLSKSQVTIEKGSTSQHKRITLDIDETTYQELIVKYKSVMTK